ncbi:MAG: co-chaperone GroES [bacterium]|nr:co-chaperone GroES [bacterium]
MKKSKAKGKKGSKVKAKRVIKKVTKKSAVKAKTGKVVNKSGVMPLGDRVLVKAFTQEEMGHTTSFGLIIPETVDKTKPNQGIVIAVGTGKRGERGEHMSFDVKPGDKIYFKKPWDEPEKINGVEYYFVQESDILAIIK